jgi:hypothetical protein
MIFITHFLVIYITGILNKPTLATKSSDSKKIMFTKGIWKYILGRLVAQLFIADVMLTGGSASGGSPVSGDSGGWG